MSAIETRRVTTRLEFLDLCTRHGAVKRLYIKDSANPSDIRTISVVTAFGLVDNLGSVKVSVYELPGIGHYAIMWTTLADFIRLKAMVDALD